MCASPSRVEDLGGHEEHFVHDKIAPILGSTYNGTERQPASSVNLLAVCMC